jgi:hypothetical protein
MHKTFCPMSRIGPVTARPASPTINIQSTLRTAPDLCKIASLQRYLVATVIHVQSVCSQICVYIHIICTIWRRWSGKSKKERKKLGSSECIVPRSLFRLPFPGGVPYVRRSWSSVFCSPSCHSSSEIPVHLIFYCRLIWKCC